MNSGEVDELLEDAVRLHREVAKKHQVIIVEGLLATAEDYFANELNAQLAKALDAKVVLVSKADLNQPRQTAEKIEASLRHFGGLESKRIAGILFMRTKGLSENAAQIPVALDTSLRLEKEISEFTTALQKFNRHIGTAALHIAAGFGCQLLAHDLAPNPKLRELGCHYVSLEALLRRSDVISLHLPLQRVLLFQAPVPQTTIPVHRCLPVPEVEAMPLILLQEMKKVK